jgi:hypothetical protein
LAGIKTGLYLGTETDLGNAFLSLGLPGGLLFLMISLATFWRAGWLGLRNRDIAALATVGLLIVTFGQWLNGGYYALAPLVWVVIGGTTQQWTIRRSALDATGPPGRFVAPAEAQWQSRAAANK